MKKIKDKYILLAVVCLLIASCSSYKRIRTDYGHVKVRKEDLAEVKYFLAFNFHQYKGKTVGEVFNGIDQRSSDQGFNEEPLLVAYGLTTDYPNYISVQVYIDKHFYLWHWQEDPNTCDLDSFKCQRLKGIKLFYKNKCIEWLQDY